MNETQIAYRREEGYDDKMPDKVGLWLMVCGENSNIADHIAITRTGKRFSAHDEHLGRYPLKHYHDGLTYPMWKFLA